MTAKQNKLAVNAPIAKIGDQTVPETRGSQPRKFRAQKWSSVRGANGTHVVSTSRRNWTGMGVKLTPAKLKRIQTMSDHYRDIPADINEYAESLRKYSA